MSSPASSLRLLLNAAVRLANGLVICYPNSEEAEKELVGVFFPIALDACFENFVQLVTERLVGAADSDRYQDIPSYIVISRTIRWLRLVEPQSTALKRKPSKSTFASWNLALKIRSLAIHFSDSTLSKRKSVPYKCVLMGHYFLDDDAGAITDLQGWCNIRSCAPSTHINAFFVLLCGNRFIASSTRCCQSTETNDTIF
jgi:hypothetical protein